MLKMRPTPYAPDRASSLALQLNEQPHLSLLEAQSDDEAYGTCGPEHEAMVKQDVSLVSGGVLDEYSAYARQGC